MISKSKNKDQKEHKELDEEDYQTDQQYEQERFTDEYSEYIEDDENKSDRFTDAYHDSIIQALIILLVK
jgi:hypothetical protein